MINRRAKMRHPQFFHNYTCIQRNSMINSIQQKKEEQYTKLDIMQEHTKSRFEFPIKYLRRKIRNELVKNL